MFCFLNYLALHDNMPPELLQEFDVQNFFTSYFCTNIFFLDYFFLQLSSGVLTYATCPNNWKYKDKCFHYVFCISDSFPWFTIAVAFCSRFSVRICKDSLSKVILFGQKNIGPTVQFWFELKSLNPE